MAPLQGMEGTNPFLLRCLKVFRPMIERPKYIRKLYLFKVEKRIPQFKHAPSSFLTKS